MKTQKNKIKRIDLVVVIAFIIIMASIAIFLPKSSQTTNQSTAQKAYNYLLENSDFTPTQAKGIVSVIQYESKFNTEVHKNTNSTGILCWTGQKEKNLQKYAEKNSSKVEDLYIQLDFLIDDIKNTIFIPFNGYDEEDFLNAKSSEDAAVAFSNLYTKSRYVNKIILKQIAREL